MSEAGKYDMRIPDEMHISAISSLLLTVMASPWLAVVTCSGVSHE